MHFTGQVVDAAADAINVWDFERVAHANTLPYHWNYILPLTITLFEKGSSPPSNSSPPRYSWGC